MVTTNQKSIIESIQEEDVTILNIYAPIIGACKYTADIKRPKGRNP